MLVSSQPAPRSTLTSESPSVVKFVTRIPSQRSAVRCCDEGGAFGFELRAHTIKQIPCEVIAPALIPR